MKNLICLLLCVFVLDLVQAQADTDTTIYEDVEEPAQFPGGKVQMMRFIIEDLAYPESMSENGIDSKLWLRFVVEIDGSISDIKLIRPAQALPEFHKEVIRLVQSMPKWIPGKVNGTAVRSYFDLPVHICF